MDHARYLDTWFEALDLRQNVTLVLHDWGSALGFYWASRHPERVRAIASMESIVQPREWDDLPPSRAPIFRDLRSKRGERMIIEENAFIEMLLPKLFINAEPGLLLIGRAREFCRSWQNQEEVTVRGIHFIQEDSPDEIGSALARFAETRWQQ